MTSACPELLGRRQGATGKAASAVRFLRFKPFTFGVYMTIALLYLTSRLVLCYMVDGYLTEEKISSFAKKRKKEVL